jgi:hypothetical protein
MPSSIIDDFENLHGGWMGFLFFDPQIVFVLV